ncbi:extracellular solute-binding protein [Paenibacillus sp. FSL K6-2524]|uniref:extracellular solute-binding protein n=1 Tax=Paenibacillus sp. FSL K6-2524 TaxID=2954516 RepID=UPI0030FA83ED
MAKQRRPRLLLLITALMVLSLLAGCGSGGNDSANKPVPSPENTSNEGSKAGDAIVLGEKPLEFSFYGNYDWYSMPVWGDDLATKWIKDDKKVNVTGINSGGNTKQKLNTMIVSDDLPDVIWGDRGADIENMRANGLLVPLDDYLDKYPNLKKWAGESTLNMLRSPDGKLYQFPNWYTSQPNGNAGYLVNKKIYEDLGSPSLETTEDLYQYLKLVKEKYPNVVPLEVGQKEGIDILASAFAENHPYRFNLMMAVPEGNELKSIFTDSAFRESLQYSNKLYREKLMTQDAFSQTKDPVQEKVTTGRIAVFASSSPTEFGVMGDSLLKAQDPDAGYIMIWPVHKEGLDKNKIFPGDYNQLGWNVSVITKAAKDPEAIFAFLDWLTGPEGQSVSMWGPEGLYWNGMDQDGSTIFTDKYTSDPEGLAKVMDSTVNFQWAGNTVYVDGVKSKFEQTLPEEKRNWETRWQLEITWKTQYNTTEFVNLDPAGDSEEGIISQSVFGIYEQARSKAVLSAKNEEEVLAILDQAEKDAQKVGYDKLLKFKTEKWQENLKNMKQ